MGVNYNTQIVTNGLVLCLDAANPKSLSRNVFPYPLDIYSWYVPLNGAATGNNCRLSQDFSTGKSPAGGIPMAMTVIGDDPHIGSYNALKWNIAPAAAGQTWTISFWAKASVATTSEILLFGSTSAGAAWSGTNWYFLNSTTINVTPEWQRFTHSGTFSDANIGSIQLRLDGPNAGGAGQVVWWDGLQVERSASASTFNAIPNINGAQWRDVSGNNTNATLVNSPAYSSGSLVFTGTQYGTVNNPLGSQTTLGQKWTVSAWLSVDDTTNQNLLNLNNGLFPSYGTNNSLLYLNGGVNDYYTYGNDVGNLGWKYITFRFDNVNNGYRTIYLNGVNISTTGPNNTSTPSGNPSVLTIANNLRGSLAKLEVYNRVLTDAEVVQNFNSNRGRYNI